MTAKGKQADVFFTDPRTQRRVAIEICLSTARTEPQQAMNDLNAGADRVLIVCPTRAEQKSLENVFLDALGIVDPRVTLCLVSDMMECSGLEDVYDFPELVFGPNSSHRHP